ETTLIGSLAGEDYAWFVESAEPIDWQRTSVMIQSSVRPIELPVPAREVKLIGASLPPAGQNTDPNNEYVDLLVRRQADLSGMKVEYFRHPGKLGADWEDVVYFADNFRRRESAVLFAETFGSNAMDHWQQVDLGDPRFGASGTWKLAVNELQQTSDYGGSDLAGSSSDRP